MTKRIDLPNSVPMNDPEGLLNFQMTLLGIAEKRLGERDKTKNLLPPIFSEDGPRIDNTATLDGVRTVLSHSSKNYWPTVLYEMGHETVHLLNPVSGCTNWLEEGIAVEFSISAQKFYRLKKIQEPLIGSIYRKALRLVRELPGDKLYAGRLIRNTAGSLSAVTEEQLIKLFPTADHGLLKKLRETCPGRTAN